MTLECPEMTKVSKSEASITVMVDSDVEGVRKGWLIGFHQPVWSQPMKGLNEVLVLRSYELKYESFLRVFTSF